MDKEFLDSIGARYTPPQTQQPQQQAPAQNDFGSLGARYTPPQTQQSAPMQQQDMTQSSPSMMDTIGKYAGSFNRIVEKSRLPKVAGGALQGAYDVVKSVGDLPLKLAGQSIPDVNLSQYGKQDALSQLAFLGGETLAQGGGEYGLYKAAGKIPGLAEKTLGTTVARGAISNWVGGENGPGGRTGSAILGGIAAPLAELNNKAIADRVLSLRNSGLEEYTNKYSNLFSRFKEKGAHTVDVPDINDATIKKFRSGNDVLESINKFRENPTIENAHLAQSDLGKLERKAKNSKEYKESATVTPLSKRVDRLSSMRDEIQNSIQKKASDVGAPELGDLYKGISKGYREEVAPYFQDEITDYAYGNKSASKLIKELARNDEFKLKVGKNHEELYRQAALKKNLGKAGKYTSIAGGGYLLAKLGLSSGSNGYGSGEQ